jgi:hypothetical protein
MQVPRDWEMGLGAPIQPIKSGVVPIIQPYGHSGPPRQAISLVAGGTYSTSPADVGSLLVVTTPSTGGQAAILSGGGSLDQAFVIAPLPVQVHLDGTPGTLIVSWQIPNGQTVSAAVTIVGSEQTVCQAHPELCAAPPQTACQAHPELCAKSVSPCTSSQVMDSVSGNCVAPCWDGSVPANGVCPVQTSPTAAPVSGTTIAALGLGAVGLVAVVWYFS